MGALVEFVARLTGSLGRGTPADAEDRRPALNKGLLVSALAVVVIVWLTSSQR